MSEPTLKAESIERALFPIFGKVEVREYKDVVYSNYSISPLGLVLHQLPIEITTQSILGPKTRQVLGWLAVVQVTSGGLTEPETQEEIELGPACESLAMCIANAASLIVAKTIFQQLNDDLYVEELHADSH